MIKVSKRLEWVQEYYFSKKLREVRQLIDQGEDIINIGIGSPDLPPPAAASEALLRALQKQNVHQYQAYKGIPQLRQGIADFYQRHYNVNVDPDTQVLPLMGSKEGIMHISMAFLNPGDQVLIPNPGYPSYASVCKLVQAEPVFYNLKESNAWLPNIEELQSLDLDRIKLMWINYPNMPTGARANRSLFRNLIKFTNENGILLVNDNPYSFILNEDPSSLLQEAKPEDHCLELNSLSKTFNMAGWRVGMLTGNAKHIESVLKVKSNMDSGMFLGVQEGAIEALKTGNEWLENLNETYRTRRKVLWQIAEKLQCTFDKNSTGLFVWAKIPKPFSSVSFADYLLEEYKIFAPPGTIFGSGGENYIRFSLCSSMSNLEKVLKRL